MAIDTRVTAVRGGGCGCGQSTTQLAQRPAPLQVETKPEVRKSEPRRCCCGQ